MPVDLPPGDDLAVLIIALANHPDANFRKRLGEGLFDSVDQLNPGIKRREAEKILDSEQGTVIEPFHLSEVHREIAVLLLQLWSSDQVDCPSIRFIGSDSLRSSGGFVIERSGRTRYEEQFLYGKRRCQEKSSHFFAPELMEWPDRPPDGFGRVTSSELRVTELGAEIDVKLSGIRLGSKRILREVQDSGRVLGTNLTLSRIGIRAANAGGDLKLVTGSPEALIRFTALCEEKKTIQVDWSPKDSLYYSSTIQLRPMSEEAVPIYTSVVATMRGPYSWLNVPLPALKLDGAIYREISDWVPAHVSWANMLGGGQSEPA